MLASPRTAGVPLARRHAGIIDGLLRQLYEGAMALAPKVPRASFVVAAVGGYGRQLLGCKSDLDVRFLTKGPSAGLRELVESMLYPLWDSGLSVGHQVVEIEEAVSAARHDLPTATALLDLRTLVGNPALSDKLSERAYATVFGDAQLPSFLTRLEEQAEERYQRFGDSVYLLEPDLKSGTGGLRDLDLALWAVRARFRTSDLGELQRLCVITARHAEEIARAADFLWAVRNHLHTRAGRRNDRLTFGEQEAIAPLMGYEAVVGPLPGASAAHRRRAMVEAFMSDYYRHARAITRAREQMIGRAKRRARKRPPREQDLGGGLLACEGGVGLDQERLRDDPTLALRMYALAVERDMPVLAQSREAIAQAASEPAFCTALRADPQANALFVTLVSTPRQASFRHGSILAELHDVGLLVAMIPEFAPVVGRVHHDLYHVYTVDVHSVAAVDRLRALTRGDFAAEQPLACRLAAEVARPHTLFMATLLHDIGKGIGWHDHARRGAVVARPILTRLGLPPDDVDDACHLIEKHLVMYLIAAHRDLHDPATVDELLRETRDREGLRDLFLLTVADLATTGPASMTPWKSAMLDALMREGDRRLSGQAHEASGRAGKVREQVLSAWPHAPQRELAAQFLDGMPERYLLSSSAAAIVAHAEAALLRPADVATVTLVPPPHADIVQLCVVAADTPGLLASIAAAISANGLEIHSAQINSRPLSNDSVQAVDLFWVRSPRGVSVVAERLPSVERDLRELLAGRMQASKMLQTRMSRPSARALPPVFTEIVIDHGASEQHTVIEVVTADRPALLFTLAQALHEIGISIHVAKINTEGSRVIDVFYVSEHDGKKVAPGARAEQLRTGLEAVLLPAVPLATSA